MKIVAGDLYMYNNGVDSYIVRANGKCNCEQFDGTVVFINNNPPVVIGEIGTYYSDYFIRLSNKITTQD